MKANEEGFTLLESALILFITSLFFLIPVLSIDKMMETIQVDLFFRELSSNITLMQNHSILNGESTKVKFYPYKSGHQIQFEVYGGLSNPLNKTMYLNEELYFLSSKSYSEFSFYGDTGRITESNHVRFTTINGRYDLTYLLGSGRFAIDKIEDY